MRLGLGRFVIALGSAYPSLGLRIVTRALGGHVADLRPRGPRCLPALPREHWIVERLRRRLGHCAVELALDGCRMRLPLQFVDFYHPTSFEPITRRVFQRRVRAGMVVVDVGAHVGYYSLVGAALAGPAGQVHAVEPDPATAACLRASARANGFGNIVVHDVAAGAAARQREFHFTSDSLCQGFYPHPLQHVRLKNSRSVRQAPVDDLLADPVHLAKIDVEGAELEVLDGMSRILAANPRLELFVEWNPACLRAAGVSPEDLPRRLRALGFGHIVVLDDRARQELPLDPVLAALRAGRLGASWYANLWAARAP
jgi:FkbM family methyltransferase